MLDQAGQYLSQLMPCVRSHDGQIDRIVSVFTNITERKCLLACARHSDTMARLGGDEFAMILPDIDHTEAATHMPARVIDALKRPFDLAMYKAKEKRGAFRIFDATMARVAANR